MHRKKSENGDQGEGTPNSPANLREKKNAASSSPIIPVPPNLSGQALRSNWNATALAYLGDAVWELYARSTHFAPPKRLTQLCDLVTASVRAEAQAAFAERLEAGGFLSEGERDVLRWGRNAKVTMPKRFVGGKAKDNGPRGGAKGKKKDEGSAASSSSSSSSSSSPPPTKTVVSGPHANVYRSATALECLVGYLYVTDPRRLHAVMRYLGLGGPGDGGEGGLAAAALAAAAAAAAAGEEGNAIVISSSGDEDSNESASST
jgi:ribonuclease-3 family protein